MQGAHMKKIFYLSAFIFLICVSINVSFAYEIPREDSRVEYMCVFGPGVSRYDGVDVADRKQVIFFDVPQASLSDLIIEIFDPDTGGKLDERPLDETDWDTIVKYSVYGADDKLLDQRNFGEYPEYDLDYFQFGPYAKELGEKVNGFYRFRLEIAAINTVVLGGQDANLFSVRVSPDNVEAFVNKISIRLLPKEGDEMFFYPEIPAGVKTITVENYDIDRMGGIARLYDPMSKKSYKINDSESGAWAQTRIDIDVSESVRRLQYIITKQKQSYANATIRVKDEAGNPLPIYFSQSARRIQAQELKPVVIEEPQIKADALTVKKAEVKEKAPAIKLPKPKAAKPGDIKPEIKCNVINEFKTGSLPCDTFTFDATGSYDPDKQALSYLWDFGDGTSSTEVVVTHVYQKGGKYKVILTVDDNAGTICSSAKAFFEVEVNKPPVPNVKIN